MCNNPYIRHGHKNREDYLEGLAESYGVDLALVQAAADVLGPNEDFDGLINVLEDI